MTIPPWLLLAALVLLLGAASACRSGRSPTDAPGGVPAQRASAPEALVADSAEAARRGFLAGFPAFWNSGDSLAHAVVEIPAGTSAKWMVNESGRLVWERRPGGARRVVPYLAYPANYGIVPSTAADDGDPLDVLVLGPALPRGSVWSVRPVGVLRLTDDGATDDKVLAVRPGDPLGEVQSMEALRQRYPGAARILRTWFQNYKGAAGNLQSRGFVGATEARRTIREAAAAFAR